MNATVYQSYEEAAQDYMAKFRTMREAPPAEGVATRGVENIPAEALVEQAGQIADISASMVPLAEAYLAAPDPAMREGISGQLLAQAAAELQMADELLQVAAGEEAEPARLTTRAASRPTLRAAIDSLERAMATPVSAGLATPGGALRAAIGPATPEAAREELQKAASLTARAITQRVIETGGDLAFNLVFKTEWASVIQSAGLVNKDVGKLLDQVKGGASHLAQRATKTAAQTLLNVFDKILALLGQDSQNQARVQVGKWLEDIQAEGKISLFEGLVGKLYQVDAFEGVLPEWLEKTAVEPDRIASTTGEVTAVSNKFAVLVGQVNAVGDVIGLARFVQVQIPQVLLVVTAIRVALLATLVYAGYDFIGYGQKRFVNVTKGVTEVIRENLCV